MLRTCPLMIIPLVHITQHVLPNLLARSFVPCMRAREFCETSPSRSSRLVLGEARRHPLHIYSNSSRVSRERRSLLLFLSAEEKTNARSFERNSSIRKQIIKRMKFPAQILLQKSSQGSSRSPITPIPLPSLSTIFTIELHEIVDHHHFVLTVTNSPLYLSLSIYIYKIRSTIHDHVDHGGLAHRKLDHLSDPAEHFF